MPDQRRPTFQRCVWWLQWLAIFALPVWLLIGTEWIAGDGWVGLLLMITICPILLVLLFAAPLLSLRFRKRDSRATHLFAVASVVTWALVIIAPFFIQQSVDSVVQPLSFAMRAGLPSFLNTPITIGIFFATFAGIMLTWVAAFIARRDAAEPFPASGSAVQVSVRADRTSALQTKKTQKY